MSECPQLAEINETLKGIWFIAGALIAIGSVQIAKWFS